MTTSTEIIQSTTTQVVTFDRAETGPFVDLVYGLDVLFAADTVGGRFDVQIDPAELHVQVLAPAHGPTEVGEIMMLGWMMKEADPSDLTVDELFQEIINRFGESETPREKITVLGGSTLQFATREELSPDQLDDLSAARSMSTARMLEVHGDSEYRSWK